MSTGYIIDIAEDAIGRNYLGLGATTITQVGFSDTNLHKLYNGQQSDVLQATAKTGNSVTFDLGSAKDINCFGAFGHNLTASATLEFELDDNPTFTSPVSVTPAIGNGQNVITWPDTVQSYRYARVSIDDATNNSFPWIGEIIIGRLIKFTHPVTWGFDEDRTYKNVDFETEFGVSWKFHLNSRRNFANFSYTQRPDAEAVEIEQMIDDAKGSFYPIFLVFDDDEEPNRGIYGHLANAMSRNFRFIEWNNMSGLNIKEQARANQIRLT
jgi:hypothetical protein